MVKNATAGDGTITDGMIKINAVINTLMGHRASIDIPVIVKDKNIIEPAVFFYDGTPYVMCKPAFDQLVKRGTLERDVASRSLYSPPTDGMTATAEPPRRPIINRQHMFSPGSMNPWKFRRYSQVQPTSQNPGTAQNPMTPGDLGACPDCGGKGTHTMTCPLAKMVTKEAIELKERDKKPRERTNIDTPTETSELWGEYTEDQVLDPAERNRADFYAPGCEVSLKEDFEVRERGGAHLVIPGGEQGRVITDVKGDGMCMRVNFPVMGVDVVVPVKFLKVSAKTIAATVDQVKHEIRTMLREGYQTVDVQAAINQKYPEVAEEALAGL
jgi:hypothetical protein